MAGFKTLTTTDKILEAIYNKLCEMEQKERRTKELTGVNRVVCKLCGKDFKHSKALKCHISKAHK